MRLLFLLLICVSVAHAEAEKMLPLPSTEKPLATRIVYLVAPPDSAFPTGRLLQGTGRWLNSLLRAQTASRQVR